MEYEGFTVDTDLISGGDDTDAVGVTYINYTAYPMSGWEEQNRGRHGGDRFTITADTPKAERWHAKDDDGIHYYSGWLVDITGAAWEGVSDWVEAYAGATAVFDGRWGRVI